MQSIRATSALAGTMLAQRASAVANGLLDRIREGNAYVNVHTNDGVALAKQGPGDFPGGEIRGQID